MIETWYEVQHHTWNDVWAKTHSSRLESIESARAEYGYSLEWCDGPASSVRIAKMTMETMT